MSAEKTDPANRESLRRAVEGLHDCSAVFNAEIPVTETHDGKTVWDGVVHIFDLEGHPQAAICYAWSSPIDGSKKRRFFAILKLPPIDSAAAAVRASIVQDQRSGADCLLP